MRTIRHLVEYLALRGLALLLHLVPIETGSALGGKAFRFIGTRSRKNGRALHHLELVLGAETSAVEREQIAADMWDMLGRIFVETLMLDRITREYDRFEMTAGRIASEIRDDGKGAVFVGAHYGNWEIAMWPPTSFGQQPVGIYRRINNPYVDRYLLRIRKPMYPGGLLLKEGVTAPKLIQMIKDGAHVGILCDQRERRGIVLPFLGLPAATMALPALLAHRLDVPLVAGRVVRMPGVRFRCECTLIEVPRTGNLKDDIRNAMGEVNDLFSAWIREHPEQWMWTHRRWDLVEHAREREAERAGWEAEGADQIKANAPAPVS